MQDGLFKKAVAFRDENVHIIESEAAFKQFFSGKEDDNYAPGFAKCYTVHPESIQPLLKELKITARCIPLDNPDVEGQCIFTGEKTSQQVIFAKAY